MRKRAQWQAQLTNILSFVHRFMKVFILFFNYICVWFGNLDNAGFIKWGKQHLIFCNDLWKWNYFSLEYLLVFPWWNHVGLESLLSLLRNIGLDLAFFFSRLESCDLRFCSAVLAFFSPLFIYLFIFAPRGGGCGGCWWRASAWGVLLEYKKPFHFLNFLERHLLLFC